MKAWVLCVLLLAWCSAVPVSVVMSNPELAPRGEVRFSYSPAMFAPQDLSLEYSVGMPASGAGSPFTVSGTDPVLVDNGVFTLAVYPSGRMAVLVGSEVVQVEPSLEMEGSVWPANTSTVQVFPGVEMAYVLWSPFNTTVSGHRVARVWYDKPWIELETFLSSDQQQEVDVRESLSGLNVGSSSADSIKMLLKDGMYEGPVFASSVIPTEGWMLAYDGTEGLGMSLDADYWDVSSSGDDIEVLAHTSVVLEPYVQWKASSFFQVMSSNLDFRSAQARYRGGWEYRFNTTSDWASGSAGQVDDQDRFENATFNIPQPGINTTLASLSIDVGAVTGSGPSLQCSLNGHLILEQDVDAPVRITRSVPVRWLEWGDNTLACYSDGGDVAIPDVYLSLAAVEGMGWVHGGDEWKYGSVSVLSDESSSAKVDVDMRDVGITRDEPTVVVLDSTLSPLASSYTYPVLSFNASLLANITNSFFIAFGDGEDVVLSGPRVSGSAGNTSVSVVGTGGLGPADVLKSVHREAGVFKKEPSSETGSGKTFIYTDGAGALFSLVVWK